MEIILSDEIDYINKILETLPEGKLLCAKNGRGTKWYISNGSTPIYISKKEYDYAQKLALRKYYQLKLKELQDQLKVLKKYSSKLINNMTLSDIMLLKDSRYYELLNPLFMSQEEIKWMEESYPQNPYMLEEKMHKAMNGLMTRSKSEENIANALLQNSISFRYECQIILNEKKYYPDFTIKKKNSALILYWEHLGMFDNQIYRQKALKKIDEYAKNGIIPGYNLILTFESIKRPLSTYDIQSVINQYLL